jgi:hypothetical protein
MQGPGERCPGLGYIVEMKNVVVKPKAGFYKYFFTQSPNNQRASKQVTQKVF